MIIWWFVSIFTAQAFYPLRMQMFCFHSQCVVQYSTLSQTCSFNCGYFGSCTFWVVLRSIFVVQSHLWLAANRNCELRTLHFPCKFGDTVYRLSRSFFFFFAHVVCFFQTSRCGRKHSPFLPPRFASHVPPWSLLRLLLPVQMSAFTSSAIKGSAVAAGSTQTWLLLSHHTASHTKRKGEGSATGKHLCSLKNRANRLNKHVQKHLRWGLAFSNFFA